MKFTAKTDGSDPAPARTPFNSSGNIITIRFNLAVATDATLAIDLAGTILHESIHAELHRLKLTNNSGPNPLPASLFNWYMQMWSFYEAINNEDFDDPLDVLNQTAADSQHNLMAFRFIDPIASGLREFDENSYPLDNYKHYVWSDGLDEYGLDAGYITDNELTRLSILSKIVRDDNHKNTCD
ncbi:hypothetical protein CLV33_105323 [Jejuia pallidilutea]|uniref:Uncharacterized protein n=1 Tax=Jejuia pallidilutea TaxID=504487 RepID=A0A362X3I1_9FLAO|nr:hypothetical protein [Jejuia pallidilutea]PQV48463.1 hypothetical protein CLV33_105323 [Jejuia pallidilutea]